MPPAPAWLTGKNHALGPAFVLGAVLPVLGLVLVAITIARSGVPPRWSGVALAAGWLIGGPLGPLVTAPLLAAILLAIAAAAREPEPAAAHRIASASVAT